MENFKIDVDEIEKIIKESGELPEGCCMYSHLTFIANSDFVNKQKNLYNCTKGAERICEIGFNAGHSALLLIAGAGEALKEFLTFDIMFHKYVRPSYEYLKNKFPSVSFSIVEGDSRFEIPKWVANHLHCAQTFDVVHVDGGHNESCFFTDLTMAIMLCKKGGKIIVDDTDNAMMGAYVNTMISSGKFREVSILKTYGYQHRIVEKLF